MLNKSAWLVMPTYQEADNIVDILSKVSQVKDTLTDVNLYAVVVDSSSPDGTAKLAEDFIDSNGLRSSIKVIEESRRGLGRAYDTGFQYAIKQGADILIQMDSDLSHDPSEIPELIDSIVNGADMAIGSRYVPGGYIPGEWPVIRVINSRVARFTARNIGGITREVNDPTAGFRAIRSNVITDLDFKAGAASGYVIQVKLVDKAAKAGYIIKEIPISFADRQFGSSKIRTKDIRQFVWFCIKLRVQK